MLTPVRLLLTLSLCFVVACDKGEDTTDESSMTSTSTETGSEPIPCGDIECAANQTCLTFPQAPMCTSINEGEMCPPDTTEAACGGAGGPCCCGPTPPTITECVDTPCDGPVDCACLVDVCIPACMTSITPGVFICQEDPPG